MSPPSVGEGDMFLSVSIFSLLHVNWDKGRTARRCQSRNLNTARSTCAFKHKFTLVEGTVRREGHNIFSNYCDFVVTHCQLTVFKPEWQCFLQTAPGSRREPGPLIDSDVFFESVLKFFIHRADWSYSAWQDALISRKKGRKKRRDKNNRAKSQQRLKKQEELNTNSSFQELQFNSFFWQN